VAGRPSDEEVYAAAAPELTRFAAGLVGPSDAADVVADAVISALRSRAWPTAGDRRAFLFRAVLLTSKSWHRSERRRRDRETRFARATVPEAPPTLDDVEDALDCLSTQQRAVVFLTYWSDLDPRAVAALLGVSEGTVRKQLARARKRLREVLT
jgi:RNA polymerase sigma-70 factor (ECF subfamily)